MWRDAHEMETRSLQDRLSQLSDADMRIDKSTDLDAVPQGVLDSARSLTRAGYGAFILPHDSEEIESFLSSELMVEEAHWMWFLVDGMRFFEYLSPAKDCRTRCATSGLRVFPISGRLWRSDPRCTFWLRRSSI